MNKASLMMKIKIPALLVMLLATVLYATAASLEELSALPSPPSDAPAGTMKDNIQIGLWTEKPVYRGKEIRNVWVMARKVRPSEITIGVKGNLFEDSFLYLYRDGELFRKIPKGGGIDGMVDPTSMRGGISGLLADLPEGTYELVWKTKRFSSNTITISIQQG